MLFRFLQKSERVADSMLSVRIQRYDQRICVSALQDLTQPGPDRGALPPVDRMGQDIGVFGCLRENVSAGDAAAVVHDNYLQPRSTALVRELRQDPAGLIGRDERDPCVFCVCSLFCLL